MPPAAYNSNTDRILRSLVIPAGRRMRHVLAVSGATAVLIDVDDSYGVIVHSEGDADTVLVDLLESDAASGIVLLGSWQRATITPSMREADSPEMTLRGWIAVHGRLHPMTASELFDMECTDPRSMEPRPPEHGVVFADSWNAENIRVRAFAAGSQHN